MAFDPACLPSLPTCPEDIAEWAEQLVACLTTNFTSAFTDIASIAVPPFSICDELGSVGHGECWVRKEAIDQTGFTYATDPSQVHAGNGILPVPPLPAEAAFNIRIGAVIISADEGSRDVGFNPPMPTTEYIVLMSLGNDNPEVYMFAGERRIDGMTLHVNRRDPDFDNSNAWIYWMAVVVA